MSDHNGKSTALSVNANPIHNPKDGHEMSVRNHLENDSPDSTEDMIGGGIGRDKMEMMEIDDMDEERAAALIMKAREPWFA